MLLRRVSRCFVEQTAKAQSIEEYGKAIVLVANQQFTEAAQEFKKTLAVLETHGLYGQPDYNFVLQRLAMMHKLTHNFPACEAALERIVQNYRVLASDFPEELHKAYAQLTLQYLQSNVTKAIQLCTWLQRPDCWNALDRDLQKDVHFFLGVSTTQTGYLLHGHHLQKAKTHLETCLSMNPESRSCFVLHNLACAQWWHSIEAGFNPDLSAEHQKAVLDFTECVPNFQKSIQLLEDLPEPYVPSALPLKVKATGLALTNVAEVLFQTGRDAVSAT